MKQVFLFVLLLSVGAVGCKKQQQSNAPPPSSAEATAPPADATAPQEPGAAPSDSAAAAQPVASPPASAPKQPAPSAAQPDKIPGASVIRAHLKNKDYAQAVGGLMALRGVAESKSEYWIPYRELCSEVGLVLREAAKTDQNAALQLTNYAKVLYGANPNP